MHSTKGSESEKGNPRGIYSILYSEATKIGSKRTRNTGLSVNDIHASSAVSVDARHRCRPAGRLERTGSVKLRRILPNGSRTMSQTWNASAVAAAGGGGASLPLTHSRPASGDSAGRGDREYVYACVLLSRC